MEDFFEAGGLDDVDLVVLFVDADGAGCGHSLAEEVDDLFVEGVDLGSEIGEGIFGGLGVGFCEG